MRKSDLADGAWGGYIAAVSETQRLADGVIIADRYRVTGVLGSGATGTVYAVDHTRLGRRLAMKVLHPELAKAQDLTQRFEREAVAIARLDHAHVVGAIDFGESEQVGWYLVTERIDGQSLTTALAARPEWTAAVFTQLLDALQHAHMQGILHRDLKPDNVLVSERQGAPFVTILDFGLAKVLFEADALVTQQGAVFGTPRYMSPEQAGGEAATSASDLYAVGVMLFEVLEGRPPFDGGSVPEILTKHITSELPAMTATPPSAAPVLQRALHKDPDARYPDARAFARQLQGVLPVQDITEAPTERVPHFGPSEPAPEPETHSAQPPKSGPGALRRWGLLVAVALLALTLVAVTLFGSDPVGEARAHLDAGRLDSAAAVLGALLAEPGPHPRAHLLQGHLHIARQEYKPGHDSYAQALKEDPELVEDERLHQGLLTLLKQDRRRGANLVKEIANEPIEEAAGLLATVVKDSTRLAVRRAAFEGLERINETERVSVIKYLSRDLKRSKKQSCRVRRWYVERLIATEDEVAIKTARAEAARKDPLLGLVPQSSCMKDLLR